MTSTWLVLALAFALVTGAAGVLYLGARGVGRGGDGRAPRDRTTAAEPPEDGAAS